MIFLKPRGTRESQKIFPCVLYINDVVHMPDWNFSSLELPRDNNSNNIFHSSNI